MMVCADIVGVLLAAGTGSRFGGNKLETMFGGMILGMHAAQTLASMGLHGLIAVHDPHHTALAEALRANGFALIDNDNPTAGLSHSLALAASAALATDAKAMLICLADMPFVTADHLQNLIDTKADGVVASAVGDTRMPPALFPRIAWPALANLTGDTGARSFLCNALAIQTTPEILADIDTRDDLNRWT